jgi:hypothetical protein
MKTTLILALAMTARVAHASPALFDAGFGPAASDLQLAVTVDAEGKTATFKVKNTGTKPVKFYARYSCSGLSMGVSTGTSEKSLDHHYNDDPDAHGLTTHSETACTRNVPIDPRTVAKGQTIEIVAPFATPGEIVKSSDKVLVGFAHLFINDGRADVALHTAPATR